MTDGHNVEIAQIAEDLMDKMHEGQIAVGRDVQALSGRVASLLSGGDDRVPLKHLAVVTEPVFKLLFNLSSN